MAGGDKVGNVVFSDAGFYQLPCFGIIFDLDFWKECVKRVGRTELLSHFEEYNDIMLPIRVLGIRTSGTILEDHFDKTEPNRARVFNYTCFQRSHTRIVSEINDLENIIKLLYMMQSFSDDYIREVFQELVFFQKYVKGEYADASPDSLGQGEKLFVEIFNKGVPLK